MSDQVSGTGTTGTGQGTSTGTTTGAVGEDTGTTRTFQPGRPGMGQGGGSQAGTNQSGRGDFSGSGQSGFGLGSGGRSPYGGSGGSRPQGNQRGGRQRGQGGMQGKMQEGMGGMMDRMGRSLGNSLGNADAYQIAPLVVGGLMTALGLRRGGWLGYGVALAGLGVMQQSFTGRPALQEWMGHGHEVDHESRAVTVAHAVTIDTPAAELYRFWRDFSNLPRFMENLEQVEVLDDTHSRWTVKGPAGLTLGWEAEVTDEQQDRRIAWRAVEGADVPNWGHVEFRPAPGGGTEVHAVIRYEPPGGMLGRAVAKLLGREPQQQMRADLARFKRMMETGQGGIGGTAGADTPSAAAAAMGAGV